MAGSSDKSVTFTGADPAHGGDMVGELMIEDADGNRATLARNVPQTVSNTLANVAKGVDGHSVTVGKPGEEPEPEPESEPEGGGE